jgi:phage shock protein E
VRWRRRAERRGGGCGRRHGLVTPQQAAELATDSDITVIDVRTPEEFAEGHIEGAMMIDFSAPDFADRVAELDPEQEYLVYCRSGNRSGQAVAIMRKLGFDRVFDMEGGTVAYAAAGLPLTT